MDVNLFKAYIGSDRLDGRSPAIRKRIKQRKGDDVTMKMFVINNYLFKIISLVLCNKII